MLKPQSAISTLNFQNYSKKSLTGRFCTPKRKSAILTFYKRKLPPLCREQKILLLELKKQDVKCVVVTHSARALVDVLCHKNPILLTNPHWLTREVYAEPNPAPDGYLKAL